MADYALTLVVRVFNEELLAKSAREHALAQGLTDEYWDETRTGPAIDIQMLMDPGDGTSGYVGDLNAVGLQIQDSSCEKYPPF